MNKYTPMQPNGLSSCKLKKPSVQSLQRRLVTRDLQEHCPSSDPHTRNEPIVPATTQSQSVKKNKTIKPIKSYGSLKRKNKIP